MPSAGVSYSHGLSCARILPWVFIPHGLLLVKIFFGFLHKYLQWAFGQLVVMFETIGQVSKNTFVNNTYYDEFHIGTFMVSNNLDDELVGLNVLL